MKKQQHCIIGFLLCTIITFMAMIINCKADTVWSPGNYDFIDEHECFVLDSYGQINAPEGYATIYELPDQKKEVAKLKNGRTLFVAYGYTDEKGMMWGIVDLYVGHDKEEMIAWEVTEGWICMRDLIYPYNEHDFMEEYGSEIKDYAGEMEGYVVNEATRVWEYPCAETPRDYIIDTDEVIQYEMLYTDSSGRRWTSSRFGWICIDDPEAKTFDIVINKRQDNTEIYPAKKPEGVLKQSITLAILPVVSVVIITGVLIAIFFGNKAKITK